MKKLILCIVLSLPIYTGCAARGTGSAATNPATASVDVRVRQFLLLGSQQASTLAKVTRELHQQKLISEGRARQVQDYTDTAQRTILAVTSVMRSTDTNAQKAARITALLATIPLSPELREMIGDNQAAIAAATTALSAVHGAFALIKTTLGEWQ